MSNITSCDSGSFCTENTGEDATKQQSDILGKFHSSNSHTSTTTNNSNGSNTNSQPPPPVKKKRNLPGNPDPSAEIIALSPNTLVATNRFICEICNKGFKRDQNLQLHLRGHNLPWKLKQRTSTEIRKRVYVCPESSCAHHNPARALGDLTGIKKHFSRKHGEKKWKCDKCSKKYAVYSDCKAHSKICGTKEYKCDCGTIFSRRDSFITHRAFCDALADENNKVNEGQLSKLGSNSQVQQIPEPLPINTNHNPSQVTMSEFNHQDHNHQLSSLPHQDLMSIPTTKPFNNIAGTVFSTSLSSNSSHDPSLQLSPNSPNMFEENGHHNLAACSPHMSATALLQKAAQMGATVSEKGFVGTEFPAFKDFTHSQIHLNLCQKNDSRESISSFVTSMAPPSFGAAQQPYSHGVMNMNQYMYNSQHDHISSQYNFNTANGMMNGVDMFNAILDQSKALSKIIEHNSRSSSNIVGGTKRSDEDVMTLDFLGIGVGDGGGANGNFYGGAQQSETDATNEVWRNWSTKNAGLESFSSSTGSM